MEAFQNNYLQYTKEIKKALYKKFGYNDCDKTDIIFNDIIEPMCNEVIIAIRTVKTVNEMIQFINSLLEYYFGSNDDFSEQLIINIAKNLMKHRSTLLKLFLLAKKEKQFENENKNKNNVLKQLSDELDEYLSIGEELENLKKQ